MKWRISPAVYESVKELTDVGVEHVVAGFSPRSMRVTVTFAYFRTRAKARDYMPPHRFLSNLFATSTKNRAVIDRAYNGRFNVRHVEQHPLQRRGGRDTKKISRSIH